MPSPVVNKAILALLVVVAITAVVVVALPLLASTQIVRYRIAQEMEALTGYRVTLGSAPEIRVWPTFRAVLRDVAFSDQTSDGGPPVVEAARVDIDLSAIAALSGQVRFSSARFIRPVIRVEPHGALYLPASPGAGRITAAIKAAEKVVTADPAKPDKANLSSHTFGTVDVSNGRIIVMEHGKGRAILTQLTGEIDWPSLDQEASVTMKGVWHGRPFSIDSALDAPLILFAGGTCDITFDLKSDALDASFDGTANLAQKSYIDGQIALTAPSLRGALQWAGSGIASGAPTGSLSVTSHVSGNEQRLKLDKAKISLDHNPGLGVIEISTSGAVPALSATLAFDQLDTEAFLTAFTPLATDTTTRTPPATIANKLDVDLRFSAAKATVGPVPLTNVAATAQVKDGLSIFDISDATAFGGSIQAGLHIDRTTADHSVELKLLATDIDLGAAAQAAKMARFIPEAKGTVTLHIKGHGQTWKRVLNSGDGHLGVKLAKGTISGFSLDAFMQKAREGGFFPLKATADGSFDIAGADVAATISGGLARVTKATATGPEGTISLNGIVPYVGGGLALSGSAQATKPEKGKPNEVVNFFVGGSWNAPFVAPAIPAQLP